MRVKKSTIQLGDVLAIPLPDGKYAFGRLYRDTSLSIYDYVGETPKDLPQESESESQFTVAVEEAALQSGHWPVVDHRPFGSDEEQWPPPSHIYDEKSGKYFLYDKGIITSSTREACAGLETAAEWEEEQVVARIVEEGQLK
ncbi:Imm26 family immunity protein [Paenibacillus tengchongensis]|uniref:Imm26 family immunity protein n=1 Tax=Paenibacillus tengchongensis TaxID=2608684 RepID=UPI00124C5997|nr:Imm26 family immunity protein [Paenibacillus tengchongensis]